MMLARFWRLFSRYGGSLSSSTAAGAPGFTRGSTSRRLLGDLCRSALRSLTRYFEVVAGSPLTPGVIAALQTFGDRINLHVHLHLLVTEGGVDAAGVFHKILRIDDSRLEEIFGREVLARLVGKELLIW